MRRFRRGRRHLLVERRRWAARACAAVLLAGAGFATVASPHALGGGLQTDPDPTTTSPPPPPDPAPTTVPRPDPAPPPPPAPRPRPEPQPPASQPVEPAPPPPPAPIAEQFDEEAAPAATQSTTRKRPPARRPIVRAPVVRPPASVVATGPAVAALRLGERIRHADPAPPPAPGAVELAAITTPAAPEPSPARLDPTLILFAGLAIGALLLAFAATPDAILARSPRGVSVARARVEVALIGGAVIALASFLYLTVSSS